jgi:hypothetical protein
MADYQVRISAGSVTRTATLSPTRTARAIWNALPIEGRAQVDRDLEIFWGATPASHGSEPRAASPVNVFGHIDRGATDFGQVTSGTSVRVERLTQ